MKRTRFGARRTMPRKSTRCRRTLTRQALELRLVFDVSPPPILQWFEGGYNTIEQRVPDIFAAGYGAVLTPPPGRADTGNQSVGYDAYNRFDLGSPGDPTRYGTQAGMKAMIDAIHQAGDSYYSDLVWNQDGFDNLGTPGFAASGGYPGFALTLNPSNNYAGYNDIDGDFHSAYDTSTTGMRLSGLIDIAQEKNYQFIRNPVDPNNPMNLPAGTTPYNGRLANVPSASNAQFYPDRNLTPITVNDPAIGQYNINLYPFNNADPMAGTPEPENALGYLMRYTQWMVQTMGVDGFRIDAAKNMPPWVLNFYDLATFRASNQTLLNGSQEPIFGFSEVYDGNKDLLQQYVNKSDNGPSTVGGNRDVLDFPLFFALQGNLTGNGYQNNWYNVVNSSVATENGYANNGSEGVSFVSSADNGPPYLENVAYAYTLTHPGNTIVYFNGHGLGANGSFPADGRGDALGGLYGDTITNLVNIRDTHPDGNYDQRYIDNNVLVYERDDSMLVGLSNRTDSGYDTRMVHTDFAPGTYLVDLTGFSANSATNEDGNIKPLLQVDQYGNVTFEVPRNSDDGNFTGDGYIIYAPASPQGTLTINGTSNVIPGGTPTAATNGTAELSPIDVVTGNSFQIQLNTNNVNLLGNPAFADPDANGDNALYKIDNGVDAAGAGFVDTNPGDVAYGFQQFNTVHSPGYFNADGSGEYLQTINTANLTNGYHYIDVRVFRHRNPGEPPIFSDFKVTIYVDHSPTTTQLGSFNDVTPGVNQNKLLTVDATDSRVNNVHVLFDLPAGLTDAQILAMIGGGNQANQIDRNLWTIEEDGLTSGNHVATVVSYQIDGTASIQRFAAQQFPTFSTSTIYGSGLGDLDFDGNINASDVELFGQVLGSDNQQFNPAADFNGDGQIDNSDLLAFYLTLQADHADAATMAAYQQLLGPPPGGYTMDEGANLALSVNQPSGTTPPLAFSWSFNNDGTFADATGASPALIWAQLVALGIDNEGTYPITLEVTDGTNTIQIPTTLAVQAVPPTLAIAGPGEIPEGQTYTLGLSASEPGGDTILSWAVNWGDGTSQTFVGNPSTATHVYQAPPNRVTITATASDEDGTYAANALPVTVDDAALTAASLPISAVEGATFSGTVASFADTDPFPQPGSFSATIDWGDRTISSGTVTSNGSGGFNVQGSHVYAEEGSDPVTVTINDSGGSSTSLTTAAQVSDAPLAGIATAGSTVGIESALPVKLAGAAFSDANTGAAIGDFQITSVDWGDGSSDAAGLSIAGANGDYTVSGSHLYAQGGTYNYSITLADDGGQATVIHGAATVAGAGASAIGDTLYLVGGATNDQVQIRAIGSSPTGVQLDAQLNGINIHQALSQTFSSIYVVGFGGNDNFNIDPRLAIPVTVVEGDGNDNIQLGDGNNVVTLGNGNDHVQAGDGNNTVTVGNGNDNIQLGDGNNIVVEGSGNDNVHVGNGDNLIVGGLGRHTIQAGNGDNVLIDGSVALSQSGDTLAQVLSDWMSDIRAGDTAAQTASLLAPRLQVAYNTRNPNTLHAGTGFDWFWAVYAKDNINTKPGDLTN